MTAISNYSLKSYTTFQTDYSAKSFFACKSENHLISFLEKKENIHTKVFVLGGGSNILFTQNFEGLIINMQNTSIKIIDENDDFAYIKADAGVVWDNFVEFCVNRNFYGVENLSLIPGTVGATPVQNIGAYGVEAKDVIYEVNTVEIDSAKTKIFSNYDCKFGYRDSIFKNEYKNKYVVSSVVFKLSKLEKFNIAYGNIKAELENFENINVQNIRQAVVNIREKKLPNTDELPNAGSFFKNPIISKSLYEELLIKYPTLVSYPISENAVKAAAGQLIDLAGLKGLRKNNVGTHENQALVIVKYAETKGSEIHYFSKFIQQEVYSKFGIQLEAEVIIL